MSTYASRREAAQMERDGIKKLPKWNKGKRIDCATYRTPMPRQACSVTMCGKAASYSTRQGVRCFGHALETRESPTTLPTEARHV